MDDQLKLHKVGPDEYDLAANENLMASRAYILFTVKNKEGDTNFNYDPSHLSNIEISGFLTAAINTLEALRSRIDAVNMFQRLDQDDQD